jgi:hypothetical protein
MQSWSAPVGLARRAVSDAHTLLLTTGADCDGPHAEKITIMFPRPAENPDRAKGMAKGTAKRTPASSSSCPDAKRDDAPGSFSPAMTKSESFSACWWIFDPSVPPKFKFIG